MTIVYRDEKGANLTPAEVDENFRDLDGRVTSIEENPPEARGIAEITQSGDGGALTIEMTDSTSEGPFTLPQFSVRFRGEWAALTGYIVNDIFTAESKVYIVVLAHTSEATFDPNANNGLGDNYYGVLLEMPEITIPAGGGEGYVLSKVSADDYDMEWRNSGVREGGTAGQVYAKISDDDYDADWRSPTFLTPSAVIVADALFEPTAADANSYFRCTNPVGCTIIINPDEFAANDELIFRQCSTGSLQIIGGNGVFLDGIDGFAERTETRGAIMHAKLVEADASDAFETWEVWGLLAPLTSDDSDFSA